MGNDYPKLVELIQRSIKLLLLHLFDHLYYSPTLMMLGQTQIKNKSNKSKLSPIHKSRYSQFALKRNTRNSRTDYMSLGRSKQPGWVKTECEMSTSALC